VQVDARGDINYEALKLLGVRYILAQAGAEIFGYTPFRFHEPTGKVVYAAQPDVGPAFLSRQVYCAKSDGEALNVIHTSNYHTLVSRAILVAGDPGTDQACHETPSGRDAEETRNTHITVQRGHDTVKVEVQSQHGGMLTLADTYYPGWHAFLDGKEVPLLRTYTTLRGVAIGPGHHSIVFSFSPHVFKSLLRVSNALLAVLVLGIAFGAVRGIQDRSRSHRLREA